MAERTLDLTIVEVTQSTEDSSETITEVKFLTHKLQNNSSQKNRLQKALKIDKIKKHIVNSQGKEGSREDGSGWVAFRYLIEKAVHGQFIGFPYETISVK